MVFLRPSGPTVAVLISYASAGDSGALGLTKSLNEGPALSVSLKAVLALRGCDSVGAAGGLSEVVAKVRAHCEAVRDRDMACRAGTANRQRERGIEAAIVCVYVC